MNTIAYYNFTEPQPYSTMFELQQRFHRLRAAEQIEDSLFLLEHQPVISIGRSPEAAAHLLRDSHYLKQQGIEVCTTNRGGDITYHGPGQLVVYFFFRLENHDIRWFVSQLEQSVINLLEHYDISAARHPEYPGVWVGNEKICALGIYVRKWVTMHGIAFNAHPNVSHFTYIIPCGIQEKGVTSVQKIYQERQKPYTMTLDHIKQAYLEHVSTTFQVTLYERTV